MQKADLSPELSTEAREPRDLEPGLEDVLPLAFRRWGGWAEGKTIKDEKAYVIAFKVPGNWVTGILAEMQGFTEETRTGVIPQELLDIWKKEGIIFDEKSVGMPINVFYEHFAKNGELGHFPATYIDLDLTFRYNNAIYGKGFLESDFAKYIDEVKKRRENRERANYSDIAPEPAAPVLGDVRKPAATKEDTVKNIILEHDPDAPHQAVNNVTAKLGTDEVTGERVIELYNEWQETIRRKGGFSRGRERGRETEPDDRADGEVGITGTESLKYRRIDVAVTNFCPVQCEMCLMNAVCKHSEGIVLSDENLETVLTYIKERAFEDLDICGGEPLTQIKKVLLLIRKASVKNINIDTSGFFAKTETGARRVLDRLAEDANNNELKPHLTLTLGVNRSSVRKVPLQAALNIVKILEEDAGKKYGAISLCFNGRLTAGDPLPVLMQKLGVRFGWTRRLRAFSGEKVVLKSGFSFDVKYGLLRYIGRGSQSAIKRTRWQELLLAPVKFLLKHYAYKIGGDGKAVDLWVSWDGSIFISRDWVQNMPLANIRDTDFAAKVEEACKTDPFVVALREKGAGFVFKEIYSMYPAVFDRIIDTRDLASLIEAVQSDGVLKERFYGHLRAINGWPENRDGVAPEAPVSDAVSSIILAHDPDAPHQAVNNVTAKLGTDEATEERVIELYVEWQKEVRRKGGFMRGRGWETASGRAIDAVKSWTKEIRKEFMYIVMQGEKLTPDSEADVIREFKERLAKFQEQRNRVVANKGLSVRFRFLGKYRLIFSGLRSGEEYRVHPYWDKELGLRIFLVGDRETIRYDTRGFKDFLEQGKSDFSAKLVARKKTFNEALENGEEYFNRLLEDWDKLDAANPEDLAAFLKKLRYFRKNMNVKGNSGQSGQVQRAFSKGDIKLRFSSLMPEKEYEVIPYYEDGLGLRLYLVSDEDTVKFSIDHLKGRLAASEPRRYFRAEFSCREKKLEDARRNPKERLEKILKKWRELGKLKDPKVLSDHFEDELKRFNAAELYITTHEARESDGFSSWSTLPLEKTDVIFNYLRANTKYNISLFREKNLGLRIYFSGPDQTIVYELDGFWKTERFPQRDVVIRAHIVLRATSLKEAREQVPVVEFLKKTGVGSHVVSLGDRLHLSDEARDMRLAQMPAPDDVREDVLRREIMDILNDNSYTKRHTQLLFEAAAEIYEKGISLEEVIIALNLDVEESQWIRHQWDHVLPFIFRDFKENRDSSHHTNSAQEAKATSDVSAELPAHKGARVVDVVLWNQGIQAMVFEDGNGHRLIFRHTHSYEQDTFSDPSPVYDILAEEDGPDNYLEYIRFSMDRNGNISAEKTKEIYEGIRQSRQERFPWAQSLYEEALRILDGTRLVPENPRFPVKALRENTGSFTQTRGGMVYHHPSRVEFKKDLFAALREMSPVWDILYGRGLLEAEDKGMYADSEKKEIYALIREHWLELGLAEKLRSSGIERFIMYPVSGMAMNRVGVKGHSDLDIVLAIGGNDPNVSRAALYEKAEAVLRSLPGLKGEEKLGSREIYYFDLPKTLAERGIMGGVDINLLPLDPENKFDAQLLFFNLNTPSFPAFEIISGGTTVPIEAERIAARILDIVDKEGAAVSGVWTIRSMQNLWKTSLARDLYHVRQVLRVEPYFQRTYPGVNLAAVEKETFRDLGDQGEAWVKFRGDVLAYREQFRPDKRSDLGFGMSAELSKDDEMNIFRESPMLSLLLWKAAGAAADPISPERVAEALGYYAEIKARAEEMGVWSPLILLFPKLEAYYDRDRTPVFKNILSLLTVEEDPQVVKLLGCSTECFLLLLTLDFIENTRLGKNRGGANYSDIAPEPAAPVSASEEQSAVTKEDAVRSIILAHDPDAPHQAVNNVTAKLGTDEATEERVIELYDEWQETIRKKGGFARVRGGKSLPKPLMQQKARLIFAAYPTWAYLSARELLLKIKEFYPEIFESVDRNNSLRSVEQILAYMKRCLVSTPLAFSRFVWKDKAEIESKLPPDTYSFDVWGWPEINDSKYIFRGQRLSVDSLINIVKNGIRWQDNPNYTSQERQMLLEHERTGKFPGYTSGIEPINFSSDPGVCLPHCFYSDTYFEVPKTGFVSVLFRIDKTRNPAWKKSDGFGYYSTYDNVPPEWITGIFLYDKKDGVFCEFTTSDITKTLEKHAEDAVRSIILAHDPDAPPQAVNNVKAKLGTDEATEKRVIELYGEWQKTVRRKGAFARVRGDKGLLKAGGNAREGEELSNVSPESPQVAAAPAVARSSTSAMLSSEKAHPKDVAVIHVELPYQDQPMMRISHSGIMRSVYVNLIEGRQAVEPSIERIANIRESIEAVVQEVDPLRKDPFWVNGAVQKGSPDKLAVWQLLFSLTGGAFLETKIFIEEKGFNGPYVVDSWNNGKQTSPRTEVATPTGLKKACLEALNLAIKNKKTGTDTNLLPGVSSGIVKNIESANYSDIAPGAAAPLVSANAERIHAENLKFENFPIVAQKEIICHIITDSILPHEQRGILKVSLDQEMDRYGKHIERIAFLSGNNVSDPDEYIRDLSRLMERKRALYEKLGYAKVRFTVACPDVELVDKVASSGLYIKALAFEPRNGNEFNLVHVDGILLALRALYGKDFERLKTAFEFLSGERFQEKYPNINDIESLIRKVSFILPAVKIEDRQELREAYDLIVKNIWQAA
jgi:hypothetical protein